MAGLRRPGGLKHIAIAHLWVPKVADAEVVREGVLQPGLMGQELPHGDACGHHITQFDRFS